MTKDKRKFNFFDVSLARNVLFGLATIWIGMFHSYHLTLDYYVKNQVIRDVFNFFRATGNVGVDIFLFLSGIGLFFSFSNDSRISSFFKKRFMRVLPSALLISVIYFSIRYITGRAKSGLLFYLSRVFFVYFYTHGERVFWFVSLILLLYILFPLFYKVIDRFRFLGMTVLAALSVGFNFGLMLVFPKVYGNIEIALCRIPVFIIGIWFGRIVKEKKEISKKWLLLFLAVVAGIAVFLFNVKIKNSEIYIYRYISCPYAISITVLSSYLIAAIRRKFNLRLLRNIFVFIGSFSLEFYMIYLNITNWLFRVGHIPEKHHIMVYVGSFFAAIILCMAVKAVSENIVKQLKKP